MPGRHGTTGYIEKCEKCEHDRWGWEDCDNCQQYVTEREIVDYILEEAELLVASAEPDNQWVPPVAGSFQALARRIERGEYRNRQ